MPAAVLVAEFAHYLPGEYRSGRYRTRDGVIPFVRFLVLARALPALKARLRLDQTQALAHAIGLAFQKQGAPASELTRSEFRAAYLTLEA